MADLQATLAIDLKDGTSGAAESAAKALQKLKVSIEGDSKSLASLQRAMKNIQGGASVNIAQFKALEAQIKAKRNAIASAQSAYIDLGGSLDAIGKRSRPVISSFAELAEQSKHASGPLADMIGRLDGIKAAIVGGGGIVLVAAVAAALIALAASAVAATSALLKYGVAQANARRSELLRLDGLTKMRSFFGFAAGNAKEMQNNLDSVAAGSAAGRDKLAEYNGELYKMGLRGDNLKQTLEAMAIKQVTQGDAAAQAFGQWAAGAALAGGSVKKLADNVKARLGGLAQKAMLDLNVQSQKLHESFDALFANLGIEPLLKGLNSITQLFSQNTKSGQALKALMTHLLQPLIDVAVKAAPIVKRFFQGLVIGALLVGIAFYTVRNAFLKAFGSPELLKGIDLATIALKLGAAAAATFVVVLGSIVIAITELLAPLIMAGYAISGLGYAFAMAYDEISKIDWSELGAALTNGLVNGIKNGAGAVIEAVRGLGTQAWSAFRERLGIASPSKAFAKLGLALPAGVQSGIERGTPAARHAAANIVDVPRIKVSEKAGKAPSAAPASARAPVTIHFGDLVIHSQTDKPADMVADLKTQLTTMLQNVVTELGGGVPV
ncbi:MAG: hypothetical protein H0X39_00480 [Actinobacteria bacterium]|nr:hypothetical protein [Actinomycetota bacterium]